MFDDLIFEDIENVKEETVQEIKTELNELQEKLGFEFENPEDIPAKVLEKLLGNLSADAKEIAEVIFRTGNVTKDEIKEFLNRGEKPDEYDNEAEARVYLRDKLINVVGEDDIDEYLDGLEDKGKLLEKANNFKSKEVEDNKTKYLKELEERNAAEQKRMTEYMTALNKEFESIQWSETFKNKVVQVANPEKVNTILNEISANPKVYLEFLGILSTYTKEGFKLDPYLETYNTKKVNNTKTNLEKIQNEIKDGKNPPNFDVSEFEIVT